MNRKSIGIAAASLFAATLAFAQHDAASLAASKTPPLSPPATTSITLKGGKKVTINYSAPSKRGRAIMGGLVPFDKVWRTGANAATTLITEADLKIGTLHVPAGTYTLYTIPTAKAWTLIVNKKTGQWGTVYEESEDLGRTPMKVTEKKATTETFVIKLVPAWKESQATLTMTWENTEASVDIALD